MRLSKQTILTSSYIETYDISDELISDFKATLSGTDKEFADDPEITNQEFILEMQDELFNFCEKVRNADKPIGYSENEEVIDGYVNEYYLDED